jgi:hypothetical protein
MFKGLALKSIITIRNLSTQFIPRKGAETLVGERQTTTTISNHLLSFALGAASQRKFAQFFWELNTIVLRE